MQKPYKFSRNYSLDLEFWSFPGLVSMVWPSHGAGQQVSHSFPSDTWPRAQEPTPYTQCLSLLSDCSAQLRARGSVLSTVTVGLAESNALQDRRVTCILTYTFNRDWVYWDESPLSVEGHLWPYWHHTTEKWSTRYTEYIQQKHVFNHLPESGYKLRHSKLHGFLRL